MVHDFVLLYITYWLLISYIYIYSIFNHIDPPFFLTEILRLRFGYCFYSRLLSKASAIVKSSCAAFRQLWDFDLFCNLIHGHMPCMKFLFVRSDGFNKSWQLALSCAAVSHKMGHHSAHFLPTLVGIHEFRATFVRSEDREKCGHERLVHVSRHLREQKVANIRCLCRVLAWLEGCFCWCRISFCLIR